MTLTGTGLADQLRAIGADLDGAARHVVWKGGRALRQGHLGGDVDVLVHPDDVARFVGVLGEHGLATAIEGPHHRDPAIVSLLGVDGDNGELVHVDAATAFVLRRPPWPTRVLPIAPGVVDRGVADPALGVSMTTAADECALRLLEWAHVPALAGRARRRDRWRRVQEALSDTNHEEVVRAMGDLVGPAAEQPTAAILRRPAANGRRALRTAVAPHTSGTPTRAGLLRLAAAFVARLAPAGRCSGSVRRQLPGGGRVIAVIGADGAGKSTAVATTAAALAPKVAVTTVYFGSGDGPSAWYRVPLRCARRLAAGTWADRKAGHRATSDSTSEVSEGRAGAVAVVLSALEDVGRVLWACTLALEKLQKAQRADRARRRGYVVLCDRYPQVQFPGGNDGPLLGAWTRHRSRLVRRLVQWEARRYEEAVIVQPDLVLHLAVDLGTAMARRPEHDPDDLAARIERVAALEFPAPTRRVDATGSPREVRARILRELLDCGARQ